MRMRYALAAVLLIGCGDPSGPPPVTRLEIHAAPTIVEACDDEDLTAWSVRVRETGERAAGSCDDTLVLSALEPYQDYTLEITGYASKTLCWRGECRVRPLPGLGLADCAGLVTDVCADPKSQ